MIHNDIIRRYAAGQSIRDIAWALGMSRAKILVTLKSSGIVRRPPGRQSPISAFGRVTAPVPKPWPR